MKPWKLLSSEFLVDAPWLKVAKEKCELPNGKVIDDFYTLWQPDWVLILARTTKGKWVMTEQYRHGTGKIALEFPAGIIDKGETPEEAAVRELQEECGYVLDERRVGCKMSVATENLFAGMTEPQHLTPKASKTRDESDPALRLGSGTLSSTLCQFGARQIRTEGDETHYDVCMDPIAATTSCSRMTETTKTPNAYDLKPITYLGSFSVNPDRHRGRFHVVFIDGVERLGKTTFDDTEDIETFLYSDEELQAKITDGTFDHPLQIAGYFKWKLTQK